MPAQTVKINLLPRQVLKERRSAQFLHWALTSGRYIIVFTELIVLMAFFSRFRLDQQLTDLHLAVKQKQDLVTFSSIVEFEKESYKLQDKISKIKQLNEGASLYIEALYYLEEIIPEDIVLTRLEFSKDDVYLTGLSSSKSGFSRLLNNLRRSGKIYQITIDSIEKSASENILTFSMKFKLVVGAFT